MGNHNNAMMPFPLKIKTNR